MQTLIVGIAPNITYEHATALKEQMEERLRIPVFVISGATSLAVINVEEQ